LGPPREPTFRDKYDQKKSSCVDHCIAGAVYCNERALEAFGQTPQQVKASQRAIELADSLTWKRIASPTVSNDGQWFAHKLTPNEGDSELVLRRISDGKEWRFVVGEAQGFGGGPGLFGGTGSPEISFSDDSKWFAFTISPTFKEGKRLKKERKPLQNKVAVVNLATEKKVEFEKVKRFSFSGENAAWIVLHKYGPESPTPAMPAGPPPSASTPHQTAVGSDLILRELASGNELNVGNCRLRLYKKRRLAHYGRLTPTTRAATGAGAQYGFERRTPLDSDKALYKGLNWNEKGDGLAAVKASKTRLTRTSFTVWWHLTVSAAVCRQSHVQTRTKPEAKTNRSRRG
jgi:hypothetical protein